MELYHYVGLGLIILAVLLHWRLKIDLRLLFLISVVLLLITAILIALKEKTLANEVAMVAYYSLLGGLLLIVAEFMWQERNGEKADRPFWGDLGPIVLRFVSKIKRKDI